MAKHNVSVHQTQCCPNSSKQACCLRATLMNINDHSGNLVVDVYAAFIEIQQIYKLVLDMHKVFFLQVVGNSYCKFTTLLVSERSINYQYFCVKLIQLLVL